MIRLTLTKERLFDLTLDRSLNRPLGGSDVRPRGYRFGRTSSKPVRSFARRAAGGVKALFNATLKIITAAKLRRIECELRIRGPRHDWLRIDDDHFTPIEH
jgi:hypothetical protein